MLAAEITREMGKVASEAEEEADGAINKDEFLALVKDANEDEVMDEATGTVLIRDPHGVVAVIAPWNFPADEPLLLSIPVRARLQRCVLTFIVCA